MSEVREMSHREILENLRKSLLELDGEGAIRWVKKAVEENLDPIETAEAVIDAIRQIGDAFQRGELFLTELFAAGEITKNVLPIIEEQIKRQGKELKTAGMLVIGTVAGDIHDIGKTLVCTMFTAAGFKVVDLGVETPVEKFVEAVNNYKPELLGLSSLMTITAFEQKKVIEALKRAKLRDKVKVIVGGGGISESFAEQIEADGYAANAVEAVEVGKTLIKTLVK